MIQSQNDPLNRLEAQIDHLKSTMNEQILKFSNIIDISNQLDRIQESWCLDNFDQDSISTRQLELDNPKLWINWRVWTSRKLNLIVNVNPIFNFMT